MQRHIIAVALALVLATAFAGCIEMDGLFPYAADDSAEPAGSQEPTDPQDLQEPGDAEETPPPSTTPPPSSSDPDPPENRAPSALITVSNETGQAPFNVTITLDGSDPDGDDLAWTLDLGDGNDTSGEGLPTTVAHNYTTAGNYTLTLTVSDGDLTATAALNVTVEAAAVEAPDPISVTNTLLAPSPDAETYCSQLVIPGNSAAGIPQMGINARIHTISPDIQGAGWIYMVDDHEDILHLRWFNGAPGHDWFVNNAPVQVNPTAAPGVIPDDATTVEVCLNADLPENQVEYTLTFIHPAHADAPQL